MPAERYDPLKAEIPGTGLPHPPSYWAATAGPEPEDDGPVADGVETDVAIIGGGYTGLACATYLARDHGIRPIVLEANRMGWGCSGRNGSFARPAIGRIGWGKLIEEHGRDGARRIFDEAMAGLATVRDLIDKGSIDCERQPDGYLKTAHKPTRVAALEEEARLLQREFNYPAEFLDRATLHRQHVGGAEAHGGLRWPDSFAMHPLKLVYGLVRLARDSGAILHSSSPALRWKKDAGRHLLSTPAGTVRARRVVLATNGYTPEHLHDCVRGRLLPVLSHIIVTRPMTAEEKAESNFVTSDCLTDTRNLLFYWRRLPDDRILFGGRGVIRPKPGMDEKQRQFLLRALKAKYPSLSTIDIEYDWNGWVCLTWDGIPHIREAEGDPSVLYAMGYMGSGVSLSMHAGRLLADGLAGTRTMPDIPSFQSPLPRMPVPALRRMGQRLTYAWYRYKDARG